MSVHAQIGHASTRLDWHVRLRMEEQKMVIWKRACLVPTAHPLAPTPMLHVPIRFEISHERESIPCTSYMSPNHRSIIQLCTYMFLAANQSWKGVHSLYIVLIAQSLLHNTTLYLYVPSSCGHPIFPISDILFIKKYPEMGRRHYRIVSSRKGLLYR